MLLQLTNKLGIITWFKINQKQLTALFCVNKNKPELKCDGKCYLKNSLRNSEESETTKSSTPTNNKSTSEEILFFEKPSSNLFLSYHSIFFFIKYSCKILAAYEPKIFQPPKL
jgi:hypothetical protein